MEIRSFDIEGVFEISPDIFRDDRGLFFESWSREKLLDKNINLDFVQDNQSFSKTNVLRGLHFQYPPFDQGKLVRVISGKVLDVAVDIRPGSTTLGKYLTCILDSETNNMLFMPGGFAHGFLALTDSILFYKCTRPYKKDWESGIRWNDPDLAIDWGIHDPLVSPKDNQLPFFKDIVNKLS